MGPKGENPEHNQLRKEKLEAAKEELKIEIDKLKQIKSKISAALSWLHGTFKQELYKNFIDAQKELDKDQTSNDKFMTLFSTRQKVNEALANSPEMEEITVFNINDFKHFTDYTLTRETNNEVFDLRPLKPRQQTFNLPAYLEKLGLLQIKLDQFINNSTFFLNAEQSNLELPATSPQPDYEEEPIRKEHGKDIYLE